MFKINAQKYTFYRLTKKRVLLPHLDRLHIHFWKPQLFGSMTSYDDSVLSKTITFLRFPLIVAVVFIHTCLENVVIGGTVFVPEGQFPIYNVLHHIVTDELARIAVPLFFFLSGFLFFYRSEFSLKTYGLKLKKRVRTLLVPYLFWNIVVIVAVLAAQPFLSSLTSGQHTIDTGHNSTCWLNLFWDYKDGMPVCFQFWFIRDLMVVILFSPLVYGIVRYGNTLGIILLGGLWTFNLGFDRPGFSIAAFFFFSFGAWFSIRKHDFTADFRPFRWPATLLYLALALLDIWFMINKISDFPYIHNIGILAGIVAVVSWTSYGIERNNLHSNKILTQSSFFVYAYHGLPALLAVKCWVKFLSPMNEWTMVAGFFVLPLVLIGIGIGIYALLRKRLPAFTALITGGR